MLCRISSASSVATLRAETLVGRNFGVLAFFGHFCQSLCLWKYLIIETPKFFIENHKYFSKSAISYFFLGIFRPFYAKINLFL